MKAFSIGQVQLPWVNLVPPIQQGLCPTVRDVEKAELPSTPCGLLQPMNEKSDYTDLIDGGPCSTTCSYSGSDDEDCKKRCSSGKNKQNVQAKFSRVDHTAMLQQQEVEQGLLSSPSIDLETQRRITEDYRELHEAVKAQGLYDCRFSEYGKEMIRYSLLFGLFMFLLLNKWYLTSAGVLGLFWVSLMVSITLGLLTNN